MKISFEQIKEITHGALRIEREEKGIRFYRFTALQVDEFYACGDFFGNGALCTTGVVLDFYTDSKTLTLAIAGGNKYEVLINGLNFAQVLFDEFEDFKDKKYTFEINPKGKRVRVTLALPSHSVGVIDYVELDEGAEITPYKYKEKLLFIGDSIVQGWDALHDTLSHAYRIARFFDAELLNHGVGGSCFYPKLFDYYDFDPDRIIVGYGTNDFSAKGSREDFLSHMKGYMERLKERYPKKVVYVVSPIWRTDDYDRPTGTFEECCALVRDTAESFGFIPIDGLALFPHDAKFTADGGLHPDDNGFGIYAENLIREILKAEKRI